MLNGTPARIRALLALLATLPWTLAPVDGRAGEWEHWRASFSASFHLPDPGQVLRRQFVEDDGKSLTVFSSPGVLPVNSLPNAYKGLANGHHLLSFAHATEYPGAPRALFPGDVIEVDAGFSFLSFRLDALTAVGFDRRINVNAVTVNPANSSHLLISLAHSATIGSSPYLPSDIIGYNGSSFSLHYDGLPLAGRNINALDARLSAGQQQFTISFESGGTIAGVNYSSSDILTLSIGGAGQTWSIFDRPGQRHAALWGRQKLQALGVTFEPLPDQIFRDRFQVE
jgi:hypothetical protein